MSFKAKDLHYEKQEPAFLRRLKNADAAADGRHNVQIARPKTDRLRTGDEGEDDPVIIDENGQVVDKAQFEGMQKGESAKHQNNEHKDNAEIMIKDTQERGKSRDVQQVAEVGGSKKRKQARVIGGESDGDDSAPTVAEQGYTKVAKLESISNPANKQHTQEVSKSKVKKKARKIKLSFDEPE